MFTVYNEAEHKPQFVEEPDPSLSYTYADYLKWKLEEQEELIKGKIFKMGPAPTPKHQQVSIGLVPEIYTFFKQKSCQGFAAPFDVRLPAKNKKKGNEITNAVQPDICVICDESKTDSRGCPDAPDLIMEILSLPINCHAPFKL
jgi:Uma2 family endonuclease